MPYWDYLATHPDQQALFDQAMEQRAGALSLACVPALDWPASGAIADIAGGTGTLGAAVLQAAPGTRGILVDQPRVLERARPFLERHGVGDRCGLHLGDLFAPPPPADLYLLASVLHDWDDPTRPASWRRWPAAPPRTRGCGSSRCCCPPTPPRTGPG
jgi:hypothetical protein